MTIYKRDFPIHTLMIFRIPRRCGFRFAVPTGQFLLQLEQLRHHFLGFRLLRFQSPAFLRKLLLLFFPLGFHLGKLLLLISPEQANAVDSLYQDQNQERKKDAYNIAGCGFLYLKKFTHAGQTRLILAQHKAVCNDIFIFMRKP